MFHKQAQEWNLVMNWTSTNNKYKSLHVEVFRMTLSARVYIIKRKQKMLQIKNRKAISPH